MFRDKKVKEKVHSANLLAWKTVRQDWPKLLNVLRSASSPVANLPPNICIPNSAKMKMKRMSRTKRALMEAMELTRDLTRLPILAQYLSRGRKVCKVTVINLSVSLKFGYKDDATW